jgi:hypothetical protein
MPAPIPLPPLDVLTALLAYDPDTGILTWRKTRGLAKAGSEAGYLKQNGYRAVRVNRHNCFAHRIAFALHYGYDPGLLVIDHINRDRSDNRAQNLRAVSAFDNRANSSSPDVTVLVSLPDGSTVSARSQRAAADLIGCSRRAVAEKLKKTAVITTDLTKLPRPVLVTFPDGVEILAKSMREAASAIGCHPSTVASRAADLKPLRSGHTVKLLAGRDPQL